MNTRTKEAFGLTGNQLKILALVAMTADHVGMILFPKWVLLRYIGRIAMPIFAWMIAEGCRYTRNRGKYLLGIAALGVVCQLALWIGAGSYYQGILVIFSFSVTMIFLWDALKEKKGGLAVFLIAALGLFWLTERMPTLISLWDFDFDYGFCGVMLPVVFYLGRNKKERLLLGLIVLILLAAEKESMQWYSLLSVPLLALYNGQRGKWRIKYLFYLYYPLHLGAIYALQLWI